MPPDDDPTPAADPPEDLWTSAMLRWLGGQDPLPPAPPAEEAALPPAPLADPDWWLAG